jgi:ribonuclease BN (tRNA processing enzyme)
MSAAKRTIRIVTLRASGEHSVDVIPNVLASFQRIIGGYLEVFVIPHLTTDPLNGIIGLADEEGWLKDDARLNVFSPWLYRRIAGTVILTRAEPGGDFIDLTDEDLDVLRDHFTYPFQA